MSTTKPDRFLRIPVEQEDRDKTAALAKFYQVRVTDIYLAALRFGIIHLAKGDAVIKCHTYSNKQDAPGAFRAWLINTKHFSVTSANTTSSAIRGALRNPNLTWDKWIEVPANKSRLNHWLEFCTATDHNHWEL